MVVDQMSCTHFYHEGVRGVCLYPLLVQIIYILSGILRKAGQIENLLATLNPLSKNPGSAAAVYTLILEHRPLFSGLDFFICRNPHHLMEGYCLEVEESQNSSRSYDQETPCETTATGR